MAQLAATRDMNHPGGYGNGVLIGLKSFFLPYPLRSLHPNGWGSTYVRYMGEFYYFGTLFMVLLLAGLLVHLTGRPGRKQMAGSCWFACALLAFLLALGPNGGLWQIISWFPIARQINNNPFRVLPFFVLFAVLAGGQTLEGLLSVLKKRRPWEVTIGLAAIVLLGYHVCMAKPAFYSYGFKPYPPLPQTLTKLLGANASACAGRILPVAPPRSTEPDFFDSLGLSLPSVYNICSVDGYDPITESRPPVRLARAYLARYPAQALRAYGVRWIIVHRTAVKPIFSPNPFERGLESNVHSGFLLKVLPSLPAKEVLKLPDEHVWRLSDSDPMAFPYGHPERAFPLKATGTGLTVSIDGKPVPGPLVVNFLWYPGARAWADGKPVRCGTGRLGQDRRGRSQGHEGPQGLPGREMGAWAQKRCSGLDPGVIGVGVDEPPRTPECGHCRGGGGVTITDG